MPCRINRARVWTHRLELEARLHAASSFVTLTFDEAHYPSDGSVSPQDTQGFLKRLRQRIHPVRIRFFAVGEYGDSTWRAHYHLVLFGIGPEFTTEINLSWNKGYTSTLPLTRELARYICGYVTKKLTKVDAVTLPQLAGRRVEFARMSLRPGIGAHSMASVANSLFDAEGAKLVSATGDVPVALGSGRSKLPLGRYLRRRLRHELGAEEPGQPHQARLGQVEEMRALYANTGPLGNSLKKPYIEYQRQASVIAKAKIHSKKGSL